ncbi:hypothetical protein Q3W71_20450 [Micromonospora sp. C28SCA-DRY-2]|uniref:hypothetical protein n=1 Tax=Micromonospora sp. C28SCA-DRY-2 TaxID=3059522 RepID=UPI0026772B07|nr:hypothetical protein [Micromonospora sp. C28SCA-DRY-2]MDO3704041.1 hypothetical protein [Micromonospora sp. C28SCA-DRY-2]
MTMTDGRCADAVQVVAPNGVTWTRIPDGRSSPADLLRELAQLTMNHVEREWDWWQEGRAQQEHDRQWAILGEWDNGASRRKPHQDPEASAEAFLAECDRRHEVEKQQRAARATELYSKERESLRLELMRTEADAAFFAHVLAAPASKEQQHAAERRMAERQTAARELRSKLGDPEDVIDHDGYYPAERRTSSLSSHMTVWRHPMLRELHKAKQRKRFKTLLAMRPPAPASMCSECQAPSQWHEYALSLCLFRPAPPAGSPAEKLARLLPGWWRRCSACTAYQLEHQWGGTLALPDFTGEQWRAMLPPMLREIFAPDPPKAKKAVARPNRWR